MKVLKKLCLEDKVEANYLFRFTAKTDRFRQLQAVLYFRSFAVK